MAMDFAALLQPDRGQSATTIEIIAPDGFDVWLASQPPSARSVLAAQKFAGKSGTSAMLPGDASWRAVATLSDQPIWALARIAETLPAGVYRVTTPVGAGALGWLLAQYRFDRYRKEENGGDRILLTSEPARIDEFVRIAEATAKVRDLVNTPAADMGPAELQAEAEALAKAHGATVTITKGDALVKGFPMVHTVGQAAAKGREPRMIELEWGDPSHPRVAIIGKGVCFDSGGLDIKPSAGMRLMKKDMGGAAHALALAGLVMAEKLKIRLHLLVPAVENAIAGNAFRPGDILASRKGLTVENTNTDAEGRLVLGDALTRACEENPALILDFATLTGAARVALGPDLPATFANDDALAEELLAAGIVCDDPLWRLPLWDGYDEMLKSDIADLVNSADGGFAGSVTAALFLRRFVTPGTPWAHFDTFAWRPAGKPGRPKGGDALGLRAAFAVLKGRYG